MDYAASPVTCGMVLGVAIEALGDVQLSAEQQVITPRERAGIKILGNMVALGCGHLPDEETDEDGLINHILGTFEGSGEKVIRAFEQALSTMKANWQGDDKAARLVMHGAAFLIRGDDVVTSNEQSLANVMVDAMGWRHLL